MRFELQTNKSKDGKLYHYVRAVDVLRDQIDVAIKVLKEANEKLEESQEEHEEKPRSRFEVQGD